MCEWDELLLSVLTPPGRGAVATLGVRGPGAIEAVGRCFLPAKGRPLGEFPLGRVVLGTFRTATSEEELVVGLVGPHEVEVHCHGGLTAVEAVASALERQGCRRCDWQQWTRGEENDPIIAEALIALAEARTEQTAAILLDQVRGALCREIEQIAQNVQLGKRADAQAAIKQLISRGKVGLHLTRPFSVVLAGRPNVGKSSLINALVGFQRAIVHGEPGTTRDVVTATTAFDGWPVELVDTAGLRNEAGPVEFEGIARARQQIESADLVLVVTDPSNSWTTADAELLAGSVLVVHNKVDLGPPLVDGRPPGLVVSALTSQGISELADEIAHRLVPDQPAAGSAVPFTERQLAALSAASAALERGETRTACQWLQREMAV